MLQRFWQRLDSAITHHCRKRQLQLSKIRSSSANCLESGGLKGDGDLSSGQVEYVVESQRHAIRKRRDVLRRGREGAKLANFQGFSRDPHCHISVK